MLRSVGKIVNCIRRLWKGKRWDFENLKKVYKWQLMLRVLSNVCLVFAGLEVKCEGTSEVDFLMPSV